jgi:hypothetical protein
MQEPICGTLIEGAVLDVLANHAGALLVAAAKETAAIVVVRRRLPLARTIMLMRHSRLRRSTPFPHQNSAKSVPSCFGCPEIAAGL